ncbi:hypothetical protein [Desulfosarcina cetonica]|uniref:hypothetical protein n=1 Tax=Desulfosarcina cetonica TaxID=90730 RepID=UPI001C4823EA|nr:hypothetical protein [Desulfosarcina cetonica]
MAFIVEPGEIDLYFTHELGKAGKLATDKRHLTFPGQGPFFTIIPFQPFFHRLICEFVFRKHLHQQVEMIIHQAKP